MPEDESGIPARVTSVHRERYELVCEHGVIYGVLKSSVYFHSRSESIPVVGDFVLINYNPGGDSQITRTLERKSFFSRPDPAPGRGEQAVAANFDYVFIIQSLNSDFNIKRLERYVTLTWQSGAIPVIILNKADLADDYTGQIIAAERVAKNAGVYAVSAKTGFGIAALGEYLKPQKTIVFLGSSGVGKSSLANALAGKDIMAVNKIREADSKGRHTTTHRQLIMLDSGAMIIDTPGMRELGMWDVKREAGYSDDKAGYVHEKQKQQKDITKYQKQRQYNKVDYRHTGCTESFTCKVCGTFIVPEGAGSQHRNHCPKCLSSIHVDNEPGDRASLCKGIMDPIGVWVRKNGEWAIIHRCRICGELSSNRIAADDNPALLMSIAVKPLAAPPFPLVQMEQDFNKK